MGLPHPSTFSYHITSMVQEVVQIPINSKQLTRVRSIQQRFYGGHLRAQSIMFSFLNMKPRILLLCYWKCHPCATVKIVHMMYSSDINGYWLQTNSLGLIFFRCHLTKFNGNVLLFCVNLLQQSLQTFWNIKHIGWGGDFMFIISTSRMSVSLSRMGRRV